MKWVYGEGMSCVMRQALCFCFPPDDLPESAGISPRRPEISRNASAHREVESAIIDTFMPS